MGPVVITLPEARTRIGAGVVYRPHPDAPAEDGVITSVGERWVHVRYRGDHGSKATAPELLSWLTAPSSAVPQ